MPRDASLSVAIERPQSLIASAVSYSGKVRRSYSNTGQTWQTEAWEMFDVIGELRYGATWMSNVLSRATLHSATRNGQEVNAATSGPAFDAMAEFFGGPEGQAQMLAAGGIHLFIAGEFYIVGRAPSKDRDEDLGRDVWEVVGRQEINNAPGGRWSIDYQDGSKPITLTDSDVIIRVWVPHPKKRIEADSPVRAALPVLREIFRLTQHIMAQIRSRLTGAGIMFIPQGISFPTPDDSKLPADASEVDKFMSILFEAMVTAVGNPEDPSAVVPIVAAVPDEYVDKINVVKFWSELDQHAIAMRSEAIRRLALSLDMPPEVLLGTATMNHWGAWQMEESSIKAHVEPILALIANALTVGYIQPITDDGTDVVAFDTSALRLRPNRSKEALELWDRGVINDRGLARETGFEDDDMTTEEEYRIHVLRKMAGGSATPEQVAAAAALLGITGIPSGMEQDTRETRPDPSLLEHPTRDLPDSKVASLEAVSEAFVLRALERAGNRIRALKKIRPANCEAGQMYLMAPARANEVDELLAGAWALVPKVLRSYPFEQQQVISHALDSYTRMLLTTQSEHDPVVMMRYLTQEPIRSLEAVK